MAVREDLHHLAAELAGGFWWAKDTTEWTPEERATFERTMRTEDAVDVLRGYLIGNRDHRYPSSPEATQYRQSAGLPPIDAR